MPNSHILLYDFYCVFSFFFLDSYGKAFRIFIHAVHTQITEISWPHPEATLIDCYQAVLLKCSSIWSF